MAAGSRRWAMPPAPAAMTAMGPSTKRLTLQSIAAQASRRPNDTPSHQSLARTLSERRPGRRRRSGAHRKRQKSASSSRNRGMPGEAIIVEGMAGSAAVAAVQLAGGQGEGADPQDRKGGGGGKS